MKLPALARRAAGRALRRYRASGLRWHLENARPELEYRLARPRISKAASTIAADLDRNGIAITNVSELVDPSLTTALMADIDRLELAHHQDIAAARAGAFGEHHKSRYRFSLLGLTPSWNPSSPFARFALAPTIREVVNTYYGLEARLRYYNVWRTFPVNDPPGDSQLWHRDEDDRYILKVFLYLSDVDSEAGPLSYIPGSHNKGRLRITPEAFKEPGHGNLRTRDDQMERAVPRSRWLEAVGPRGTLVLVDTGGYHKGGFSRSKERNVYTCMYTSPASEDGDLFAQPSTVAP